MSKGLSEDLAWTVGWHRAQKLAQKTLSGIVLLDAGRKYPNARFRAFQASAKIWERLCSRELRTEDEVKDAAKKIGMIFEKGNQRMIAKGKSPIQFNQYQKKSKSRRVYTELEWMADICHLADGETGPYKETLKELDLASWKPWEVMYVTGLRAIDDAARAIVAGDPELAMSLVYDALNEMYMCDVFANGNERNKEYDSRLARIYGLKGRDFAVTEKVNEKVGEAVKAAVKNDRIDLAKTAASKKHEKNTEMRRLVIERWKKEKASYKKNKSDFARHYSRLLLQKNEFEVKASTIATRWLRGL
ncbi:MAG: hypothetical protein A3F74_17480 [Betaproteobacteria bacterium RIFCSPLOWO2_12_FULL_62_58]|nr:MAG: hypothetical protein A3F74_17480 [Betaproteobacteria bacterium RIFCSPLOWO2_12_FULL_62_58]